MNIDNLIDEFDKCAWYALVECVTVQTNGSLVFEWKDGTETVMKLTGYQFHLLRLTGISKGANN